MSQNNTEKNNLEIDELKHRLERLEANQKQSHTFFKHTLSAITIIFLFVGVIITVLSIVSKKDVDTAVKDMERKFEVLSNQALDKPELVATYQGVPIKNNDTVNVSEYDRFVLPLSKIRIINNSKKPTNEVKVGIYFSERVSGINELSSSVRTYGKWDEEDSLLSDFVTYATYDSQFKLNPKEIWSRPCLLEFETGERTTELTSMRAKLVVYYGVEKPLEVYFNLTIKNNK